MILQLNVERQLLHLRSFRFQRISRERRKIWFFFFLISASPCHSMAFVQISLLVSLKFNWKKSFIKALTVSFPYNRRKFYHPWKLLPPIEHIHWKTVFLGSEENYGSVCARFTIFLPWRLGSLLHSLIQCVQKHLLLFFAKHLQELSASILVGSCPLPVLD